MTSADNSTSMSGKKFGNLDYVLFVLIIVAFVTGMLVQYYANDQQRLRDEASSILYWQENSEQIGGQLRDLVATNETKQMWIDHYCHPPAPMYEQMNKDFCTTMLKHGANSFDLKTGERLH